MKKIFYLLILSLFIPQFTCCTPTSESTSTATQQRDHCEVDFRLGPAQLQITFDEKTPNKWWQPRSVTLLSVAMVAAVLIITTRR